MDQSPVFRSWASKKWELADFDRKIDVVGGIGVDNRKYLNMLTLTFIEMSPAQIQEIRDQFAARPQVCEQVIGLFNLLSNKVRFRIVCVLTHGEACVQEIADVVAEGRMSNISQQLRMLRLAGVVSKRRDKKQNVYRISDERIRQLIGYLTENYLEAKQP